MAYPVGEERLYLPLLEVRLVGEPRDGVPAEGEARRPLRVARLHLLHPEWGRRKPEIRVGIYRIVPRLRKSDRGARDHET